MKQLDKCCPRSLPAPVHPLLSHPLALCAEDNNNKVASPRLNTDSGVGGDGRWQQLPPSSFTPIVRQLALNLN